MFILSPYTYNIDETIEAFKKAKSFIIPSPEFINEYDEEYLKELRLKAKGSWKNISDVDEWLREIRGSYEEL